MTCNWVKRDFCATSLLVVMATLHLLGTFTFADILLFLVLGWTREGGDALYYGLRRDEELDIS